VQELTNVCCQLTYQLRVFQDRDIAKQVPQPSPTEEHF
jgi:hypothetical protein